MILSRVSWVNTTPTFEVIVLPESRRMDAGAVQLDLEELDLAALVAAVLTSASPIAHERDVAIRARLEPGATVLGDRRRLSRIIRNLVTNALEYGAGKPVDVVVATSADSAAVGVRDRGPGMAQEQVRRVFDRFWRADASRRRTLGGSGLGLSIAAEDAALHRAALQVVSEPDAGSLFVLTLPRGDGPAYQRPVPLELASFDAGPDPASAVESAAP